MKKLLFAIILLLSANVSANLVHNGDLTIVAPILGVALPEGFNFKKTGTVTTTISYPKTGQYGTFSIGFQASGFTAGAKAWMYEPPYYRIPVTAGRVYEFSDRTKCTGYMDVRVEMYRADGSVFYTDLPATTIPDNVWRKTTYNFSIPTGVTKVSVGRLAKQGAYCNIDNVKLIKL